MRVINWVHSNSPDCWSSSKAPHETCCRSKRSGAKCRIGKGGRQISVDYDGLGKNKEKFTFARRQADQEPTLVGVLSEHEGIRARTSRVLRRYLEKISNISQSRINIYETQNRRRMDGRKTRDETVKIVMIETKDSWAKHINEKVRTRRISVQSTKPLTPSVQVERTR